MSLGFLATSYSCKLASQTQKFTPRRPCCLVHHVQFQKLHGDRLLCIRIVSIFVRKALKELRLTCSEHDIRWQGWFLLPLTAYQVNSNDTKLPQSLCLRRYMGHTCVHESTNYFPKERIFPVAGNQILSFLSCCVEWLFC